MYLVFFIIVCQSNFNEMFKDNLTGIPFKYHVNIRLVLNFNRILYIYIYIY